MGRRHQPRMWRVFRWAKGEYHDQPWGACDRGAWFGIGATGRSFATHAEAIHYADRMARTLPLL